MIHMCKVGGNDFVAAAAAAATDAAADATDAAAAVAADAVVGEVARMKDVKT